MKTKNSTQSRRDAETGSTAVPSAMPPQPQTIFWIDVKDHLPDDEITVLGYLGNGEMDLVFHSENEWFPEHQPTNLVNVWFWAALPDLPAITAFDGEILIIRLAMAMWNDGNEVKTGIVPPWEKLPSSIQNEWIQHAQSAINELQKGGGK